MDDIEIINGNINASVGLAGIDRSDENDLRKRCAEASARAVRYMQIIESDNLVAFHGTIRVLMEGRDRVNE